MAERLKDTLIPQDQVIKLANAIAEVYPDFNSSEFCDMVLDADWAERELMQKKRHITLSLKTYLPDVYLHAIHILEQITHHFKGFIALSFSDYAEYYGGNDWYDSLTALARFTRSCSSEFGVRSFLDQDPVRTMEYFYRWAEDENQHIRRLASEGCRPRLPWGMALPKFKKDPSLILPILEKLKSDPEEYVRRSVANNLNDISKDHPGLVLELCNKWKGQSPETDRLIKHACRTMLKAGNKQALLLFGYGNPDRLNVLDFTLGCSAIQIGDQLNFSFLLANHSENIQTVRLEYRIHYMKSGGKTSAKIFQISEGKFAPGEHRISKKQAFTNFTTRTHFSGEHRIEIVVNGETKAERHFMLSC